MRRFAELGDQGSASNGSAAQERAANGIDGNSGGSHTLSLLQQALERVVQPLLQSPHATPDQQIAAAAGLAQIAGTLQALAMQASGAAQPPELARAVAATLAAAVGSQPAADAAAPAAAAAATAAVPAAAQEQLDSAVVSSLAATRALLDVGAGPQGAANNSVQPVQAALLSAALAALRGPAASAPQLAALQDFLASAAAKLAASQPKLLAAAAGSLLQAADTAVAEATVPKNGSGAASSQLQAVLQAVLRWGAALPAPAASALPTATGGSGATAAVLPVVGEEDHQQPADTSAEAPAQPALELEGQLGAPEQQPEAANEAASPAAEEPAAAAAGSADEAPPEADAATKAEADAAEQQGSRGDAAAEHAADGPSEAADTEAAGVTDAAEAADGAGDWPDEFEGADDSEWVAEAAGAPEAAEQGAGVQPAGDAAEDVVPPPQQPAQPLSADDKAAAAARQRSLQVNGVWPWIVPRGFRLRFASEGRTKSFQLTWEVTQKWVE